VGGGGTGKKGDAAMPGPRWPAPAPPPATGLPSSRRPGGAGARRREGGRARRRKGGGGGGGWRPAEETGADCMGPPWRWGPLPLAGQNDSHGPHSRQDEPCHLPKVPGVEAAQEQNVLHAPEDRLRVLHTALVWHGDDDPRGCEEAEEPIRWRVEPVAFTNREVPRSPAKPEECSPQPRRTGPLSDVNAAEDNPATGRAQLKAVGKDNHFGDGG